MLSLFSLGLRKTRLLGFPAWGRWVVGMARAWLSLVPIGPSRPPTPANGSLKCLKIWPEKLMMSHPRSVPGQSGRGLEQPALVDCAITTNVGDRYGTRSAHLLHLGGESFRKAQSCHHLSTCCWNEPPKGLLECFRCEESANRRVSEKLCSLGSGGGGWLPHGVQIHARGMT